EARPGVRRAAHSGESRRAGELHRRAGLRLSGAAGRGDTRLRERRRSASRCPSCGGRARPHGGPLRARPATSRLGGAAPPLPLGRRAVSVPLSLRWLVTTIVAYAFGV